MINIQRVGWMIFLASILFHRTEASTQRIVSANGTLSEIVAGLGLANQLVGVDITSNYPSQLKKLPQLGHHRSITAEGIIALNPTALITTDQSPLSAQVLQQLKASGVKVITFQQSFTEAGAIALIREVGKQFKKTNEAEKLVDILERDLRAIAAPKKPKKLLFIYARGTGTLMVAGEGTPLDALFKLIGHRNAVQGFQDFKPLTAESLVMANPDVLVLFDSGLESLEGLEGLLKVPGVASTNAGRNRNIISMDGQLLTGYGPRLGKAAAALKQKIN